MEYSTSQINLRGCDFVIFNGSGFNKFNHVYEGQKIKVLCINQTSINITGNIRTNTGVLKTVPANSFTEFIIHNGIAYELN